MDDDHDQRWGDLALPRCETCESEIELLDAPGAHGVCRHCGIAFLLDADVHERRRVG